MLTQIFFIAFGGESSTRYRVDSLKIKFLNEARWQAEYVSSPDEVVLFVGTEEEAQDLINKIEWGIPAPHQFWGFSDRNHRFIPVGAHPDKDSDEVMEGIQDEIANPTTTPIAHFGEGTYLEWSQSIKAVIGFFDLANLLTDLQLAIDQSKDD